MTAQAATKKKAKIYENSIDEIKALIKARVPIIWVLTHEEGRFIDEFAEYIAEPMKRQVWLWSSYQGLIRQDQQMAAAGTRAKGEEDGTHNPQKALQRICTMKAGKGVSGLTFLMRDMHTVLAEPLPRQVRDIYEHLIDAGKTLIITSPVLAHGPGGTKTGLPPTLEKQVAVVSYELPTASQIETRVRECVQHMKTSTKARPSQKTKLDYPDEAIHDMTRALQGLSMIEVDDATSTSVTHKHRLDQDHLLAAKRQLIKKNEILEFIDTPYGLGDVGGMDQAKEYLQRYGIAHSEEAKEFGVEPLKGILLTGVPGTGKSLLAKVIGRLWKVPLLRLDVGKVMTGLVGGSEGKMRDVIMQAEAMSPCVLWIDEVEKSLAGTKSSNFSDGGTLARVFGTLLTAMQDGMEGVTIVATANDITLLPPEFIRRYNEVFFVDLPGPDERWEIFKIHLEKRGKDLKSFEKAKDVLLEASDNYTGAEIEKAVKDAIADAFHAKQKGVNAINLLEALKATKPISTVMGAKVAKLREKARGQYRYASTYAEEQSGVRAVKTKSGKTLDLGEALDDFDEFVKTPKEKHKEVKKRKNNRFSEAVKESEEAE
jgi:SpoVK/Ycf46/Vps4 family AAA+-type ATPase